MRPGGQIVSSACSSTPTWQKRLPWSSEGSSVAANAASLTCSEGTSINLCLRKVTCWLAALVPGSESSTLKGVYSPKTAVNPISIIAMLGSPNFTLGLGGKTGGSFPTGCVLVHTKTGGSLAIGVGCFGGRLMQILMRLVLVWEF